MLGGKKNMCGKKYVGARSFFIRLSFQMRKPLKAGVCRTCIWLWKCFMFKIEIGRVLGEKSVIYVHHVLIVPLGIASGHWE